MPTLNIEKRKNALHHNKKRGNKKPRHILLLGKRLTDHGQKQKQNQPKMQLYTDCHLNSIPSTPNPPNLRLPLLFL